MKKDHWNTTDYQQHASYVSQLGGDVIKVLAPQPGEKILDIGCGDGEIGVLLNQLGCSVIGIDSSESLVATARDRGVEAYVKDAHDIDFNTQFEAVFSNAALHWMLAPKELLEAIARALKPGGRFVAEMGGHGNIATVCAVLSEVLAEVEVNFADINPWFFPTVEQYDRLLKDAGFDVEYIELIKRPTELPTDLRGWMDTFTGEILKDLSPENQEFVLEETTKRCAEKFRRPDGKWEVDYVRLRFKAILH